MKIREFWQEHYANSLLCAIDHWRCYHDGYAHCDEKEIILLNARMKIWHLLTTFKNDDAN